MPRPHNVTQWEYIVEPAPYSHNAREFEADLNKYGKEGWELCAPIHGNIVLKRPAPKRNF